MANDEQRPSGKQNAKQFAEDLRDTVGRKVADNETSLRGSLGRAARWVDQKTGGKYSQQIGRAESKVGDGIGWAASQGGPTSAGSPGAPGATAGDPTAPDDRPTGPVTPSAPPQPGPAGPGASAGPGAPPPAQAPPPPQAPPAPPTQPTQPARHPQDPPMYSAPGQDEPPRTDPGGSR